MRLDFFVASTSGLSRKEAKRAISAGRVLVDNVPCTRANTSVCETRKIALDGTPLVLPGARYLMLNKPAGVVSATRDGEHATALDLLPAQWRAGLHIVGRLDRDTTGLLLLTDDGQWSHRVTSPRIECPKTYRAWLAEPVSPAMLEQLAEGVLLKNDPKPTRPAEVRQLAERIIELTITEGRYHQVKRMLAAVGNHVTGLHRSRIGGIILDPALAEGDYRALTADEIASVG
ncbi:pseudouridine synthase [Marinobacter profundi]|uniref:Pseudouridine synthase n=1 Tax=Marinobacter profundi TaxID=2666256 RepID=A0A2G1UI28_9GAMM|nr:pseudouridine synthase [Marinobacter profundi]PHQ14079.1 16S rRNA pseudouridine(516) synthase [Marinobacter profundi]